MKNVYIYFCRNNAEVNIIYQELQEEFSDVIILPVEDTTIAAKVLLEELDLYFKSSNSAEWQRARVKTDLLIP